VTTIRAEAERVLRAIGAAPSGRSCGDIAEAALALASFERPRVRLDRYRAHLCDLAAEVGRAAGGARDPAARLAALNAVIVETHRYEGDALNYDDLQNANLMRVIDRRKGLPVALGILYLHAARAQGWAMAGLAFPGHFLLRLGDGDGRVVVDPFHGGAARAPHELRDLLKALSGAAAELRPDYFAEIPDRDILLRLQNNIKLRLMQQNDAAAAAAVVARMLLVAPDSAVLWREAGLLNVRAGNLQAAIDAFERYLALETRAAPRHEAATLLQRLRERLN